MSDLEGYGKIYESTWWGVGRDNNISWGDVYATLGDNIVRDGLVTANNFLQQSLTHPAQGSAEFNGTSDYVQLPTSFSHTNHTIAAWVYLKPSGLNKFVIDSRDAGDDGLLLYFASDEKAKYSVNASTLTSSNVIGESWYYIVGTYDGTTQKLYVDGSLDSSQPISQTINTTTNALIGARSHTSPNFYMDGNLANVAIWNRALTSDEINSVMWKDYNALSATEKSGLQAWYALDDIDGTSVPDSSGNGNNGTGN